MNVKNLVKRHWLLATLNLKVKDEINRKASCVINSTNSEMPKDNLLEDISNLLSLEWKLDKICYYTKLRIDKQSKIAVKERAQ